MELSCQVAADPNSESAKPPATRRKIVRMEKNMAEEEVKTPTLEEQIAAAVAKSNEEWQAKFQAEVNKASKAEREKYEKKLKEASMTEAERLQHEREEDFTKLQSELATLKGERAAFKRKEALRENQLPSFYEHDERLLKATDDDFETVIKSLKKEHTDYVKELTKTAPQGTAPKVSPQQTSYNNNDLAALATNNPEEYRRLRREQLYGKK